MLCGTNSIAYRCSHDNWPNIYVVIRVIIEAIVYLLHQLCIINVAHIVFRQLIHKLLVIILLLIFLLLITFTLASWTDNIRIILEYKILLVLTGYIFFVLLEFRSRFGCCFCHTYSYISCLIDQVALVSSVIGIAWCTLWLSLLLFKFLLGFGNLALILFYQLISCLLVFVHWLLSGPQLLFFLIDRKLLVIW